MKTLISVILTGSFCALLGQQEGTIPRWEIIQVAENLEQNAGEIQKLLEQVRPKEWIQDGAPQAYVSQYENLQSEIQNLSLAAQQLAREPEKLSTTINSFLWLDRVSSMVESMAAGVRKYQNPAIADLLSNAIERTVSSEDTLKIYMKQRAVDQEAELEIAHSEAQRCRSSIVKRPRSRD